MHLVRECTFKDVEVDELFITLFYVPACYRKTQEICCSEDTIVNAKNMDCSGITWISDDTPVVVVE